MKDQRVLTQTIPNFPIFGFEMVSYKKPHDFAVRATPIRLGPAEVFDEAINTNYFAVKVLDGFEVEEVRSFVSSVIVLDKDCLASTSMLFWNKSDFFEALVRTQKLSE